MYTFVCVLFEFTFKNFNVVIYESDDTIMYVWNSVLIVCIVIEFTLCAFHSEFCLWNGDRETCATKFFVATAGDVWKCVAKEFNFCLIMLKLFSIFVNSNMPLGSSLLPITILLMQHRANKQSSIIIRLFNASLRWNENVDSPNMKLLNVYF